MRRVEFSSLTPGKYRFEVSAKTNNTQWGTPTTVSFSIEAHFWEKTWFIFVLIAAASFTFYKIAVVVTKWQKNQEQKQEISLFVNKLIALVYALKHQLRHTDCHTDMARLLPEELASELQEYRFKPIMVLKSLGDWVQANRQKGNISSLSQLAFEENLNKLSDIIGGCERLATTPIPYSYSILLHRTVYIYCFMLPFGFVDILGWLTPFILAFVAYTFLALEA
ncbi:MAG: hypothetical protein EOO88_36980, partial [Pedobacter sp.]